jgi:hypothetical protein
VPWPKATPASVSCCAPDAIRSWTFILTPGR